VAVSAYRFILNAGDALFDVYTCLRVRYLWLRACTLHETLGGSCGSTGGVATLKTSVMATVLGIYLHPPGRLDPTPDHGRGSTLLIPWRNLGSRALGDLSIEGCGSLVLRWSLWTGMECNLCADNGSTVGLGLWQTPTAEVWH
jgi:hypothetical protein